MLDFFKSKKQGEDTTDPSYSKLGKEVYGKSCEFTVKGRKCNWDSAQCDVHHIDYQEHNKLEEKQGKQMPKNNSPENLSVLCPNHHRIVHHLDMGKKLLQYLPERKKSVDNK